AFFHRALLHDRRDIVRDADEPLALFRIEPKIFGEDFHRASAASALRSGAARTPARRFLNPAAAIIAALSVESCRLGSNVGISRRLPRSWSSARKRLLADTPPAMPTLRARNLRPAPNRRSLTPCAPSTSQ